MGTGKTYSTQYLLDSNNSSGVAGQVLSTTSTGIDWVDANTVPGSGLWLASGNNIYNSNSGRVGIGVTSPLGKLHVEDVGAIYTSLAGSDSAVNFLPSGGQIWRIGVRAADNSFRFTQNSSSLGSDVRVTFANGGNVGIGTTSPSTKLEVVDTFSVQRTSTDNEGLYVTVSGSDANAIIESFYQEDSSSQFGYRKKYDGSTNLYQEFIHDNSATGTEVYRVDRNTKNTSIANGNVGIGTTSPTTKIHVIGQDATFYSNTGEQSMKVGRNVNERLELYVNDAIGRITAIQDSDNNGPHSFILNRIFAGTGSNDFLIQKDGSTQLVVNTNGNVGIGTTGPVNKIQANYSPVAIASLTASSGTASTNWNRNAFLMGTGASVSNALAFGVSGTANDRKAWIQSGHPDSAANSLGTISLNPLGGNVGIGTTSPGAKLHVKSTSATGANFILETTHTGGIPLLDLKGAHSAQLRYKDELDVIQGRIDFGDSGTFNFIDVPNNNSTLYLKTGGNVGIGTTGPGAKLTVKGSGLTSQDFFHIEDSGGVRMLEVTSDAAGNAILQVKNTSGTTTSLINSSGNSYFNGGNVGIGNTAPGTKLHVGSGSGATVDTGYQMVLDSAGIAGLQILSATTQSGRIVFGDSGDNDIGMIKYDHTDNSMGFRTNGSGNERIRISSAGAIRFNDYGAGTLVTDASGNITVSSGGGAGGPYLPLSAGSSYPLTDTLYITTTNQHIRLNNGSELGIVHLLSSGELELWGHGDGETINFRTGSGTGTIAMNVVGTNVGIGTTSPQSSLEVVDSANYKGIHVRGSAAPNITFGQNADTTAEWKIGISGFNGDSFSIGTGTGANDKLHITNTGNVGIGVINPGFKLQIATSGVISGSTYSWPFDLSRAGISSTRGFSIGVGVAGGSVALGNHNGDISLGQTFGVDSNNLPAFYETMRISHDGTASSGKVGIGVTGPNEKLEVNGAVAIGNATDGIKIRLTGTVGEILGLSTTSGSYNDLDIRTQAATQLYLKTDGNVGIGTTSPGEKLSVTGNIEINVGAASAQGLIFNENGTQTMGIKYQGGQSGNPIDIFRYQDNTTKVRFLENGNVGIGTTSPNEKLSLPDNAKIGLGNSADLQIYHNSTNDRGYIYNTTGDLYIENDATNGDIKFFSDDGSGGTAEYLRIDGQYELVYLRKDMQVADNVKIIFGDSVQQSGDLQIYHDGSNSYISDIGTGNFNIQTDSSIFLERTTGENMAAFRTSNVELYYSGSSKFETTSTGVTVTGNITVADGTKAAPSYSFTNDPDTGMFSDLANTLRFGTAANTRMTIEPNGEVGINTTGPSAALHLRALSTNGVPFKLEGDANTTVEQMLIITSKAYNSSDAWYNLVSQAGDGSGGATNTCIIERDGDLRNKNNSYGQISDSRLKENIIDATPKLDDVMKVKVKNFNFIGEDLKQIGVVAQELEEVFPGLVKEDKQPDVNGEEGGIYKSVKYSVLVPILVKAMQEQQEIIEDLKTRITKLENNN